MRKSDVFAIILLFYLGWFGAVILGTSNYQYATLLFPALLVCFLFYRNLMTLRSFALAAAIAAIGILFDGLLLHFGLITIAGATGFLIPEWLIAIWFLFAFAMMHLGPNLRLPLSTAIILGFVFGPLSYKSGEIFNSLSFTGPFTVLLYAVFWALLFPAVLGIAKKSVLLYAVFWALLFPAVLGIAKKFA